MPGPHPPNLATLMSRPSWVSLAGRVDRAAYTPTRLGRANAPGSELEARLIERYSLLFFPRRLLCRN